MPVLYTSSITCAEVPFVKKSLIALFVLMAAASLAFAADFSKDGMLLRPGTVDVNAGVGWGWGYGFDVVGGGEYILGKFDVAKNVPLSYGVAARASIFFGYFDSTPVGVGAFGTLHFNWGALQWPTELSWLKNLDSYIGLGIDLLPRIGFDGIGGTSYFFAKNLAVNFETGIVGSTLGVLLKL
jgi:hypothetical protein